MTAAYGLVNLYACSMPSITASSSPNLIALVYKNQNIIDLYVGIGNQTKPAELADPPKKLASS